MNDATRELGASLGIAVLGSLAATRYTHSLNHALNGLSPADRSEARGSLGGALNVAGRLRGAPAEALTSAAHQSFVNGVHLAVTGGALLAGLATIAVARYLPRDLTHEAVTPDRVAPREHTESLGLTGVLAEAGEA